MLKKVRTRLFAPVESHADAIEPAPLSEAASDRMADTVDSSSVVSASSLVAIENKQLEVGGRSVDNNGQSQNAVAVGEIFNSTKLFEDRFGKLLPAFEQVGHLGSEAAIAFESIKTLANNLEKLTGAFEPLKSLQDQLAMVASSFDPVSSLQGRFAEVSNAFRDQLKHLIGTLQPARAFHARLVELATTFDSASELQRRLERLSAAFDSEPQPTPASKNGSASEASATAPLT